MLADTAELARDAAQRGQGLAAFNVVLLDHAEAFIDAAQEAQLPLVLQLSQNAVVYHGGRLAPIGRGHRPRLRSPGPRRIDRPVPCGRRPGLHLDHVRRFRPAR